MSVQSVKLLSLKEKLECGNQGFYVKGEWREYDLPVITFTAFLTSALEVMWSVSGVRLSVGSL